MDLKNKALQALRPNAEFHFSGEYVTLEWVDKNQSKPSESEYQLKLAELQAAEPMRLLRQQRNQLLAQSDWMANSDVTMSEEWRFYRQALRDITTQTPSLDSDGNLTGITWPTPPND